MFEANGNRNEGGELGTMLENPETRSEHMEAVMVIVEREVDGQFDREEDAQNAVLRSRSILKSDPRTYSLRQRKLIEYVEHIARQSCRDVKIEQVMPAVEGKVRKMVKGRHNQQQVVQEAMLRLCKSNSFCNQSLRGKRIAFADLVARSVSVEHFRKETSHRRTLERVRADTPPSDDKCRERADKMRLAMACLTEKQRRALRLVGLYGCDPASFGSVEVELRETAMEAVATLKLILKQMRVC